MTDHDDHTRPHGASDADVEAAGKISEALEWVERARGHLYSPHQLLGRADFLFADAAGLLDACGQPALAERVRADVVGRNVLAGRWTFQVVEEFDDGYYAAVRAAEQQVRDGLLGGRRHVYESEMKEQRRTHGQPGHERRPDEPASGTVRNYV